MGTQREPNAQRGTHKSHKLEPKGPNKSPKAVEYEPKGFQKRKIEKVPNTKSPKVDNLKKYIKMKGLKSEHVDVLFILEQKMITPRKIENV